MPLRKLPRPRKKRNGLIDDEFSEELKSQGEDGQYLRMLYLRNPMTIYAKKVNDESIRH